MTDIVEKIDDTYIAWFHESNSWVLFEEPAGYILQLAHSGKAPGAITKKFSEKYGTSLFEAEKFTTHILSNIRELQTPSNHAHVLNVDKHSAEEQANTPYSSKTYLFHGKKVSIAYGTRLAEYYLHPLFTPFECENGSSGINFYYKIYGAGPGHKLFNLQTGEKLCYTDFNRLKKRFFIQLANDLYSKSTGDWLSFIHGSAVSNHKNSIILSSACGSGKSTMAALMQTNGFNVDSDDFIPIDIESQQAHPFPAAISVKQGAFSLLSKYYKGFYDTPKTEINAPKHIRYIPNSFAVTKPIKAKPVKAIVFIEYNPKQSCSIEHLPIGKALGIFHQEAWVSPNPEHARVFIDWVKQLRFFRLIYGINEKGINTLSQILQGTI